MNSFETVSSSGARGIWALKVSLTALMLTTTFQVFIVAMSGSVALLADTIHNLADALNSIPLLIAFYLARRAATRRYTYGFARAEDIAGILIILSIAVSAGVILWEASQKLLTPQPMANPGWVAAAAVVGFLGNEAVAQLQIRAGRSIGSAALVADGLHARADGLTSLAVLFAVIGSWLGFPIVDPLIGFLIGITILFITRDAAIAIWYRLMDTVEPGTLARAEAITRQQPELKELRRLRMRWVGHHLHAEVYIAVDPNLTTAQSHHITEHLRHDLFHAIPNLTEIVVHVEPWSESRDMIHQLTVHHEPVPQLIV